MGMFSRSTRRANRPEGRTDHFCTDEHGRSFGRGEHDPHFADRLFQGGRVTRRIFNAERFHASCQRTVNHVSGNFDINGTAVAQQRGKGSIHLPLCGQRIVQCDSGTVIRSKTSRCVPKSRTI